MEEGKDVAGFKDLPVIPPAVPLNPPPPLEMEPHIRLPIPTLSENNIDGYFLSMEFWFRASNITSDGQKFNTVLCQIPPNKLIDLKNIIEQTPDINKYDYIKDKLLQHYTDSQQRRLRRVLSEMPLGDQKPSQLLNAMRRVADGALTDNALLGYLRMSTPP